MDEISIPASDVLSLIQSHLVESGLHSTSRVLSIESGGAAKSPGLTSTAKSSLVRSAIDGRWGEVLTSLGTLDVVRYGRGGGRRSPDDKEGGRTAKDDDGDEGAAGGPSSSTTTSTPLERAIAMAHEMTILELAEEGEYELAYAALRSCSGMLDRTLPTSSSSSTGEEEEEEDGFDHRDRRFDGEDGSSSYSRSGDVERRIAALISTRRSRGDDDDGGGGGDALLPPSPADYYGSTSSTNNTRQGRRDIIARALRRHVPELPPRRLVSLLQQSVKWQCHTGTFPTVERLFRRKPDDDGGGDDDGNDDENDHDGGEDGDDGDGGDVRKKKKGKKKRRRRDDDRIVERRFDLVLGNVDVDVTCRRGKDKRSSGGGHAARAPAAAEKAPSRLHQTIRLGKKSFVECACFLPDGTGLVTGSSDGFVEIWGEIRSPTIPVVGGCDDDDDDDANDRSSPSRAFAASAMSAGADEIDFETLRTSDLPYQRDDDLMMHDSSVLAVDVSNDGTMLGTTTSNGTVCVWKISDGKLLRKLERAHGGVVGALGGGDKGAAVTCIRFLPDGTKILTGGHDSTCREFGLLASRMLKEFRGHKSYVNCCSYVVLPTSVLGTSGGGGGANGGSRRDGGDNRFLAVITGSADGSVIVWDGRTAEPIREINPPIPTSVNAIVHDKDSIVGSKSIHTVVHLHSPPNAMIVVPRSDRAYLMSYSGAVLRVYARDDVQGSEFLAAAISPSNQWLFVAADDGKCVVFDVGTGKAEKIIRSFSEACSSGRSDKPCEVSGLVCHPHRGLVGGYSSDKGQKRGILALWK